ncbi:hypothetical protein GLOTRDRAFT_116517 [Gloeophyllum trabeum ATCC 11539]|uniref:RRM domain-containing protein n=1 Tax=Gloeophyllum trabeum (strain ATCC 11539 / FP-39264 / Madison 617) TaxID=670483 RepID=S7Q5D8_GLOTA|nr:uncharacterized protein GLOTRDRAFT_116517 [Gloeophyllum trabeum ATCC 11539]EPQ54708.1 hypothetical protein GLOTRDRAFT_116517 [Gloeophyllum trabeum ATCC 11539]
MTTHAVNVSNLAPTTTEDHLRDFFTFCGKIVAIDLHNTEPKTAVVHFEKPSAAKTALMLNGGTLDGAQLTVTSDTTHHDEEHEEPAAGDHIEQEHKPRAGIVAEYLAKGYTLSDSILERAIKMDTEKGISQRFLAYFNSLDKTIGSKALGENQTVSAKVQSAVSAATQQAKAVDEQKGITKSATEYYSKALASPWGQKVRQFYTTTSKQVLDIHEEARRIADQQKASGTAPAPAAPTAPGSAGAGITGGPATTDPTAPATTVV